MESPGAPATANPSSTTLPVMFAVKTRPRPRKLTASITPVTPVRVRSASGKRLLLVISVYPKPTHRLVGHHTRGNEKCRQGERGETLFDAEQQRSSRNPPTTRAASSTSEEVHEVVRSPVRCRRRSRIRSRESRLRDRKRGRR